MDTKDMPSPEIESKFDYVVFSYVTGVISEHPSATEAVVGLIRYLREHPGVNAAIYRRIADQWRVF